VRQRRQTGTVITVGMGTCGIAAGARETLQAIQSELDRRQIDAMLVTTGCIGVCVSEPLVDIQQAGGARILYANVQPDMVRAADRRASGPGPAGPSLGRGPRGTRTRRILTFPERQTKA
jgi:hypothetical protein